jgi:hypothetical protein
VPDTGCETDLTSPQHCGSCGKLCPAAAPLCTTDLNGNLGCAPTCGTITPTLCGTRCVDIQTDPNNCSACGRVCPSGANMVASCTGGVCGNQCNSGFHVCKGLCVDDSSVDHCAASCDPCAVPTNGTATCDPVFGCDFTCNSGFMKSNSMCVPIVSSGDMAGMLPPCDCRGLQLIMGDQCPITHQCVGPNCCLENTLGLPGFMCMADPTCSTSPTPQ